MNPMNATPHRVTLRPEEPKAKRLSSRLGILGMIGAGLLIFTLVYGIISRQRDEFGKRNLFDADKRVTSARDAASQFKDLTAGDDTPNADALEPPPLKFVPRRNSKQGKTSPSPQAANGGPVRNVAVPRPHANGLPPGWESPNSPAWSVGVQNTTVDAAAAARQRALDRQRQAMDSETGINGAGGRVPSASADVSQLANLAGALTAGSGAKGIPVAGNTYGGPANGGRIPNDDEDNSQTSKQEFLAKARKGGGQSNYVPSTRMRALSPYEIKAGWDIPAVLEQDINSDLPGEVRALVRENVYDTASGQYLLIPQGARLVGEYDSKISYAQGALLTVWNRLIFPDGSSIDLDGMNSQDAKGESGLRGKVNNHYTRIFGTAALSTAFSIAAVLAQTSRQQGVVSTYPSTGDVAASAAGSEIARLGAAVTRRNLTVQPTIRILTGTRFSVRVHHDLLFPEPYRPFPQTTPPTGR